MRSIRLFSFAVVAILLAFAGTTGAHAQSLPLIGGPNAASIGLFLPSSGDTNHDGGSSQLYLNLQYGFPVNVPFTPTRTVVNLEGEFGNNNGHHSNIVPLTIGEYVGSGGRSPFASHNVYGGVGAGVYLESIGSSSSTGQIGGYALVGYNVAFNIFVQAKYQFVKSADGPIVSVGARF